MERGMSDAPQLPLISAEPKSPETCAALIVRSRLGDSEHVSRPVIVA